MAAEESKSAFFPEASKMLKESCSAIPLASGVRPRLPLSDFASNVLATVPPRSNEWPAAKLKLPMRPTSWNFSQGEASAVDEIFGFMLNKMKFMTPAAASGLTLSGREAGELSSL